MVSAVVGSVASSAVPVSFPVGGPRKGGRSQESDREPRKECEGSLLAHSASPVFIWAGCSLRVYRSIAKRAARATDPVPPWQSSIASGFSSKLSHAMLVTAYHLLARQTTYQELGTDYYDQRHAERARNRTIQTLERQNYRVTLQAAV